MATKRPVRQIRRRLAALLLAALASAIALGMGTEGKGNDPLHEGWARNSGWTPELLPLVNLKSRVYWYEVNGDFHAFFRGGTEALNEALTVAGGIPELRRMALLPGPGAARTFDGEKIPCDFELHVPGGFYLGSAKREKDTDIYEKRPIIRVFVRLETISLDALKAPDGMKFLGAADLIARYTKGTKSAVPEIRGMASTFIADLGPWVATEVGPSGEKMVALLEPLLMDPHEYVRRSAAGALARLGKGAAPAIPALEKGSSDPDKNVRSSFEDALKRIRDALKQAPETSAEEAAKHQATRDVIQKFLAGKRTR